MHAANFNIIEPFLYSNSPGSSHLDSEAFHSLRKGRVAPKERHYASGEEKLGVVLILCTAGLDSCI